MVCTYSSKPSCNTPPQTDVIVSHLKIDQETQDNVLVMTMPAKILGRWEGVIIRVSIAVTNTMTENQVGEGRIFFWLIFPH